MRVNFLSEVDFHRTTSYTDNDQTSFSQVTDYFCTQSVIVSEGQLLEHAALSVEFNSHVDCFTQHGRRFEDSSFNCSEDISSVSCELWTWHANIQNQRPVGSKDIVETNGRTDGGDCITFPH